MTELVLWSLLCLVILLVAYLRSLPLAGIVKEKIYHPKHKTPIPPAMIPMEIDEEFSIVVEGKQFGIKIKKQITISKQKYQAVSVGDPFTGLKRQ